MLLTGMPLLAALFTVAYLVGSVNFSILICRLVGYDDPRHHGSGNPGATNVYRLAGIGWASTVLLLDVGRAVSIAIVAKLLLPFWQVPWVGLGLIVGNRFTCFHGFNGGKGVANYLGFTAVVAPLWAALGGLFWGVTHVVYRTPFLSSFALVFALGAGTALAEGMDWRGKLAVVATVLFIVACHHRNIRERWARKG
jgi:glycerol-3-phosphate acyltransferase PlsY